MYKKKDKITLYEIKSINKNIKRKRENEYKRH